MRAPPPTPRCNASTSFPFFPLFYFCPYFCDLSVPATLASPPSCLCPLCYMCFCGYFCDPCVATAFLPLLSLCMPSCGYFCDLCVAAAFLPYSALLHAVFAATSATFCVAAAFLAYCALLYAALRLLLRPLCRRRLLALLCFVACSFAAASATFCVAAAFSPFFVLFHAVLRLLLQRLCRRRFLALLFVVVCIFAATPATFVSLPSSGPSSRKRSCGYSTSATFCVAAAFLPYSALLHVVWRLLLRPWCRRRLCFRFYVPQPLCDRRLRCRFYVPRPLCCRRLPKFPLPIVGVSCSYFCDLCVAAAFSMLCCMRFRGYFCDLCVAAAFLPFPSLCGSCFVRLSPATFVLLLLLPCFMFVLLRAVLGLLSSSAFPSPQGCPFFVPVHHRCLGSVSALQCCVPLTVPSCACWS